MPKLSYTSQNFTSASETDTLFRGAEESERNTRVSRGEKKLKERESRKGRPSKSRERKSKRKDTKRDEPANPNNSIYATQASTTTSRTPAVSPKYQAVPSRQAPSKLRAQTNAGEIDVAEGSSEFDTDFPRAKVDRKRVSNGEKERGRDSRPKDRKRGGTKSVRPKQYQSRTSRVADSSRPEKRSSYHDVDFGEYDDSEESDEENLSNIVSPGSLLKRMSIPIRALFAVLGFVLLYCGVLSTDRWDDSDQGEIDSVPLNQTSADLPRAWHASGKGYSDQKIEVEKPRNYALESALENARAAAKSKGGAPAPAPAPAGGQKKDTPKSPAAGAPSDPSKKKSEKAEGGGEAKPEGKDKEQSGTKDSTQKPAEGETPANPPPENAAKASDAAPADAAPADAAPAETGAGSEGSAAATAKAGDDDGEAQSSTSQQGKKKGKKKKKRRRKKKKNKAKAEAAGESADGAATDPATQGAQPDTPPVPGAADSAVPPGGPPGAGAASGSSAPAETGAVDATGGQPTPPSDPGSDPGGGGAGSDAKDKPAPSDDSSDDAGLAESFADLDPRTVENGKYPVLHWNYDDVLKPETTRQVFSFKREDHVGVYKPMCIVPKTGKIVALKDKRVCGGYNRTEGWMIEYCDTVEDAFDKENEIDHAGPEVSNQQWLASQEAAGLVQWIEGLTVFQIYHKNCGNIAHFAGRALMLHHVLENIAAYAAPPSKIENILILPTFHIMKRFLYAKNYEFWHKTIFRAIIAPAEYSVGTLGNFLYREKKNPFDGVNPRVHLLHNFSLDGSDVPEDKLICFRRAVVPGYLKSRYFISDKEYPSKRLSLQPDLPDAPQVPRDALRFRERVSALAYKSTTLKVMRRKVVYLDRGGTRRLIQPESKDHLFAMLKEKAEARKFSFEVASFDKMTFSNQLEVVEDAGIVLGVHGANLVNTIFMQPLSVLIELFPYQFSHEMYEEGGGAGLKYFSYQMTTGTKFQTNKPYRDAAQCIRLNHECKVHYRDAELIMQQGDIGSIGQLFDKAMDWYDAVTKDAANANSQRRRLAGLASSRAQRRSRPRRSARASRRRRRRRRRQADVQSATA